MDTKPCAICQAPIEQSRTYCGAPCRIEGLRRRNQATTKLADEGLSIEPHYIPPQQDDWRRPAGPREAMESWHRKPMNHGRA